MTTYTLRSDNVFYGPAKYPMHILARRPDFEKMTQEQFEKLIPEIKQEIANCIGCVSVEWVEKRASVKVCDRIEVPMGDDTGGVYVIPAMLTIIGSGFMVTWEIEE